MRNYQRRMKMVKRGEKSAIGVCEVCSGDKLVFQLRNDTATCYILEMAVWQTVTRLPLEEIQLSTFVRTDRNRGRGKKMLIDDINARNSRELRDQMENRYVPYFQKEANFYVDKELYFFQQNLEKIKINTLSILL